MIIGVSSSTPSLWTEAAPNALLGTIWIVKESLWKEHIPDYDSTREMHFGLSALRLSLAFFGLGTVPMLHGRSKPSPHCFAASGLDGTDARTHFGHLGPVQLPMTEISDNPTAKKADLDLAWSYDYLRVRPNHLGKRKLSPPEESDLVNWLKRRAFWD